MHKQKKVAPEMMPLNQTMSNKPAANQSAGKP